MEYKQIMFGTGASFSKEYGTAYQVIDTAFSSGLYQFDTAPSYKTEEMLGDIIQNCREKHGVNRDKVFLQTKIDAWQMQNHNGKIVKKYAEDAVMKLKTDYIDSLLIHWPVPEYLDTTWDEMIRLKKSGMVKQIGICNVRMRQLEKMKKWEVVPDIIQIERNPLRVCASETKFCREQGFLLQAYSPLCKMDTRIRDSEILKKIAEKYAKNIGQIVMRWHIDSGYIPIFTSTKPMRVKEYLDIFDFQLSSEEILEINSLNEDYKMYLEACACPGF